jgi:hypothetical protein
VLVAHGRANGAVAHPSHQLLGGRAGLGGELVAGVAEVVEVELRCEPNRADRGGPVGSAAEVAAPQPTAVLAEEDDR